MSTSALPKRFAQWLFRTRQEQGVSTRELAARTGLHATAISYTENTEADVRMTTFVALAKALGHEPSALLLTLTASSAKRSKK